MAGTWAVFVSEEKEDEVVCCMAMFSAMLPISMVDIFFYFPLLSIAKPTNGKLRSRLRITDT